jgi:hypothetical protein
MSISGFPQGDALISAVFTTSDMNKIKLLYANACSVAEPCYLGRVCVYCKSCLSIRRVLISGAMLHQSNCFIFV